MKYTLVIGATERDWLPAKVCEFTARKHWSDLSQPFEVVHTFGTDYEPKGVKSPTGFSFVRFWTPHLASGVGRALYVDSDMLFLRDPKELFDWPLAGCPIARAPSQSSVLLFDAGHPRLRALKLVPFEASFRSHAAEPAFGELFRPGDWAELPREWNSVDSYEAGKTKLLHYSDMSRQPWRHVGHPLNDIWVDELRDAMVKKFIDIRELWAEQEKGHIRRDVLERARYAARAE